MNLNVKMKDIKPTVLNTDTLSKKLFSLNPAYSRVREIVVIMWSQTLKVHLEIQYLVYMHDHSSTNFQIQTSGDKLQYNLLYCIKRTLNRTQITVKWPFLLCE